MNEKQPLDNTPLMSMLFTGGTLLVLGLVIWLANTDFDHDSYLGGIDDSSPVGQYFGSAISLAGLLLLALGWAAAAVCRQIADIAQTQRQAGRE
jgi:hypothetical protein